MRILYETETLKIGHTYELAYLVDKATDTILFEDDFYGDPECGLIDHNERWLIIAGDHLTLWRNNELTKFSSATFKDIHAVRQIDNDEVEILTDPWSSISAIWKLNVESKELIRVKDFDKYFNQEYTADIIW